MTLQLQGGRRTTGENGKDATGFRTLNCLGPSQKALQLKRVDNLDDRDLLCSHVSCKADVAMIRSGIQMRVSGRYRCSRYAEHRGDRKDHDNYAG
jgi:hypothetical protein